MKTVREIFYDGYEKYDNKSPEQEKTEEESDAVAIQGATLISLGVGAIVYGRIEMEKNWAPYATFEGITKEYNAKLLKELNQ